MHDEFGKIRSYTTREEQILQLTPEQKADALRKRADEIEKNQEENEQREREYKEKQERDESDQEAIRSALLAIVNDEKADAHARVQAGHELRMLNQGR
jgi:hypothetical protein